MLNTKGIYNRNRTRILIITFSMAGLIFLYRATIMDMLRRILEWTVVGTASVILDNEVHRKIENREVIK